MPFVGSLGPNSSVRGFHLSLTLSLGSTRGLCSLGRSQKSSWRVTISNQMCLLTQGPSDHPGAGLGGHLEKRALVLAVQWGHLPDCSWINMQSPPAHSSHVAKVFATLRRKWFVCGRTLFWQSLCRNSLCLCKHVCARAWSNESER